MQHTTIRCQHCEAVIGRKHILYDPDKRMIVAHKHGTIVKTEMSISCFTYPYGDMETEHTIVQKAKIHCEQCNGHTTATISISI